MQRGLLPFRQCCVYVTVTVKKGVVTRRLKREMRTTRERIEYSAKHATLHLDCERSTDTVAHCGKALPDSSVQKVYCSGVLIQKQKLQFRFDSENFNNLFLTL